MIVAGMLILVVAAEVLVRAAVRIATAAGLPPVVIGLTVVAFGTSAPELFMSVSAAVTGDGVDVAVGNVVGSGVSNVLVILGVAAFFGALRVHFRLVRLEVPLLIGVTAAAWVMASNGQISRAQGVVLLFMLVGYTTLAYFLGRREESASLIPEEVRTVQREEARKQLPVDLVAVLLTLGGLIWGADLTVNGATRLAAALGVDDLLIGLTIVAVGTSLPELVTAVIAVRRNQSDLAVGNVVGSNLFNLLGVFGTASVVGGVIPIPDAVIQTDFPVAVLVSLIALPVLASGLRVERWEGTMLLLAYAVYVAYLIVDSQEGGAPSGVRVTMFVALSLVALVVAAVAVITDRRRRHAEID